MVVCFFLKSIHSEFKEVQIWYLHLTMYIYMTCMYSTNSMHVIVINSAFLTCVDQQGGCLKFAELSNLHSKLSKHTLETPFFRGSGGWGRKSKTIPQEKSLHVLRHAVSYAYPLMFKITWIEIKLNLSHCFSINFGLYLNWFFMHLQIILGNVFLIFVYNI